MRRQKVAVSVFAAILVEFETNRVVCQEMRRDKKDLKLKTTTWVSDLEPKVKLIHIQRSRLGEGGYGKYWC